MKKVYLELTNRCNLDCLICYRKAWHEKTKDMNEEDLFNIIEQLKSNARVEKVVLGGIGEPTFAKHIHKVIHELKDKELIMTTNGTIMSDRLVEDIVKHIDHLVISIDGTSEMFYKIRQFPLEKITDNIGRIIKERKRLKSSTPKISFQMVLTTDNMDEVNDVIELAALHGANQIIFSNIIPASIEDESLAAYKLYDSEPLKSILASGTRKALRKGLEIKQPEVMLKTERRCRFIEEETMVINMNGYIVPCYRLAHDGSEVVFGREKTLKAHSFGHVSEASLEEIWNKEDYINYRHMVYNNLYPSCMDCDLVDGCDMAKSSESDCYGSTPSCADCLWSRRIVYCE